MEKDESTEENWIKIFVNDDKVSFTYKELHRQSYYHDIETSWGDGVEVMLEQIFLNYAII